MASLRASGGRTVARNVSGLLAARVAVAVAGLIRLLGPQGVPMATAIGVVAGTCQFLSHYHTSTGQRLAPMARVLAKPLAAAAVAAVAGELLSRQLPDGLGRSGALLAVACRGSVVLLVAVVVLLALGSITVEDRERVAHLFRRPIPRIASVSSGET